MWMKNDLAVAPDIFRRALAAVGAQKSAPKRNSPLPAQARDLSVSVNLEKLEDGHLKTLAKCSREEEKRVVQVEARWRWRWR